MLWELSGHGEARQHRALRLIGVAFVALAGYLTVQTAIVFATGYHSQHSPLGIAWTAITAAAMVLAPATPEQVADEAADRAAIAADTWRGGARPAVTDPNPVMVDRLARAMATDKPWQRVTDETKAMLYFTAEALRRLTPLDTASRGLLLQAEEARATARRA